MVRCPMAPARCDQMKLAAIDDVGGTERFEVSRLWALPLLQIVLVDSMDDFSAVDVINTTSVDIVGLFYQR